MPLDESAELLTITRFTKLAGIGKTLAYELLNSGTVRAKKIGKKTMIPREEFDAWKASLPDYKPLGACLGATESGRGREVA